MRPRSALGLKYVELIPGRSKKTYEDGGTIPLSRASQNAPELEDVLSTFPPRTRDDARKPLEGFGDSIAGRGPAINATIRELEPFTRYLLPVMRNLSDPKTELKGFFPALEAAAAQAAPVAQVQARWFGEMADDLRRDLARSDALRETIEETPPTLTAATESFRVQTPFLARFADRVAAPPAGGRASCPRTLPPINEALAAGVPAFRRDARAEPGLEDLFGAARGPWRQPQHAARAPRPAQGACEVTRPAVEFVAPYQTVCNYLVYFFNPLGTHQSSVGARAAPASASWPSSPTRRSRTRSARPSRSHARGRADRPGSAGRARPAGAPHPVRRPRGRRPAGEPTARRARRAIRSGSSRTRATRLTSSAGGFVGGGSHVVVDRDTPGPRRRHLQVAAARHRQDEGRAVTPFKAGVSR